MYKVDDRNKIENFLSLRGSKISDWAEEPQFLATNRAIVANTLRENLKNTNLNEENKKLMDCVLFLYKKSSSYFQAEAQAWYLSRVYDNKPDYIKQQEKKNINRKKTKEKTKNVYDIILDDVTQYLEEKQINLYEVEDLMKKVMDYIDEIVHSYDIYSDENLVDYTLRTADIIQKNKQEQPHKR